MNKSKNLLKLSLLSVVFALILISPMTASAQPTYDPSTGRQIQTLDQFNEQQRNSLAGQAADSCGALKGIANIICKIHNILNSVIPVLVSLGVVYLVWGVVQYVIGNEEEAKKKGKDRIIYGVIGLAIIVGLWGLVNIVVNTFDFGGASAPTLSPLTGESANCSLAGKPKFQDLLCYVTRIINDSVIPLIFALAVAMFVWGVVQFVINSDEEAKKAKGKQFMLWGIIALAVMVSVWGLVGILSATFGINGSILPQVKP